MAVLMVGLLIAGAWDYSKYLRLGNLIFTNRDDCGNLDVRATPGGVILGIKDEPQGNYSVDGNVYIPAEQWSAYAKQHSIPVQISLVGMTLM
jgi:hypothetical protein